MFDESWWPVATVIVTFFLYKYYTDQYRKIDKEELSSDMTKMYNRKMLSDVILRCGEKSFAAHKCILSARSRYFEALFKQKTAGTECDDIIIDNVEWYVFEEFISYMYSGEMHPLDPCLAYTLYHVSKTYKVKSLLKKCDNYIKNIHHSHFFVYYDLTDRYEDEDFKNRLEKFAIQNAEHIVNSSCFQKFKEKHPTLALRIYDAYGTRKSGQIAEMKVRVEEIKMEQHETMMKERAEKLNKDRNEAMLREEKIKKVRNEAMMREEKLKKDRNEAIMREEKLREDLNEAMMREEKLKMAQFEARKKEKIKKEQNETMVKHKAKNPKNGQQQEGLKKNGPMWQRKNTT